jgi:hypothetical protein
VRPPGPRPRRPGHVHPGRHRGDQRLHRLGPRPRRGLAGRRADHPHHHRPPERGTGRSGRPRRGGDQW